MASRWANDDTVREQIDSTVENAVVRARSQLPRGESLIHCKEYDATIPEARRRTIPNVRLCVNRQAEHDREQTKFGGYNRHGSKDSRLR